jgi:hypothetical protein
MPHWLVLLLTATVFAVVLVGFLLILIGAW